MRVLLEQALERGAAVLRVVCVGGDAFADLLIRPLHLGVVAVDVVAGEAEQFLVVGSLEPVATGAFNRSHWFVLSGL